MKLYRISSTTVCTMLALALASPGVSAQNQDMPGPRSDGMMGQGGMAGGGVMMGTGGPGPSMILRMGDALGLTDQQRAELEAVQEEYQEATAPMMSSMTDVHRDAAEALAGDSPDFDAYEDALREAADTMVEAHLAMARAASEARAVLTDEQRAQLQGGMQMIQGMMGQGQSGTMMGPGGNR